MSYKELWKPLIDRDMKKRELCELAGVSTTLLANLGKGENITTGVLIRICRVLDRGINDIMEILPENSKHSVGIK